MNIVIYNINSSIITNEGGMAEASKTAEARAKGMSKEMSLQNHLHIEITLFQAIILGSQTKLYSISQFKIPFCIRHINDSNAFNFSAHPLCFVRIFEKL